MIRITSLVENTSSHTSVTPMHGLSLYIETDRHRVLFDVGPDELYAQNAEAIGIDLRLVDTVVISHGHYDHGGGLRHFLSLNQTATVYVKRSAFAGHYSNRQGVYHDIGLEAELQHHPQVVLTDDFCIINEEWTLFSGVSERRLYSSVNDTLAIRTEEGYRADFFDHEQYAVLTVEGTQVLFTGCSHIGILNIVRGFERHFQRVPSATVIGGFHLHQPSGDRVESPEHIAALSAALAETPHTYYTCHCTGEVAYRQMKERMGERLRYLSAGDSLVL